MASSKTAIVEAASKLATLEDARTALEKVYEAMGKASSVIAAAAGGGSLGASVAQSAGLWDALNDRVEQTTNRADQLRAQIDPAGEGPLDVLMAMKLGQLLAQANDVVSDVEKDSGQNVYDLASVVGDAVAAVAQPVADALGAGLRAVAAGAAAGAFAFWPYLVAGGVALAAYVAWRFIPRKAAS